MTVWLVCEDVPNFYDLAEELRKNKGRSLQWIALQLGFDPSVYGKRFRNSRWLYLEEIEQYAKALGCNRVETVQLIDAYSCLLLSRFMKGIA